MSTTGAAFSVRFLRNGDQVVIVRRCLLSNFYIKPQPIALILLLCSTLCDVVATGNGGCSLITGTKLSKKVEGELDRALFCFNFPPDVDDVAILLVGHGEDAD